jgi:signal peptidase II
VSDALTPWRRAGVMVAVVVALDQMTKAAAHASLAPGERSNVFFGLDLVNAQNRGVAFGFLAGGGAPMAALMGIALAAVVTYFVLRSQTPLLWFAVGLVLGGALGNLADRARDGAVTDFINPVLWPAFNLADAAIVVGVLALLYVVEGSR